MQASVHNVEQFQCDLCPKSYKRRDHLSRHLETHIALGPVHLCLVCKKRFSRKDVMMRHQALHENESPDRARKKARTDRSRFQKACSQCASKKVRCDGEMPCASCVKRDLECYRTTRTASRGPPSIVSSTSMETAGITESTRDDLAQDTLLDIGYDEVSQQTHTFPPSSDPGASFMVESHDVSLANGVLDVLNSEIRPTEFVESRANLEHAEAPVDWSLTLLDFLDWELPSQFPSQLPSQFPSRMVSRVPSDAGSPTRQTERDATEPHGVWLQDLKTPQNTLHHLPALRLSDEEKLIGNTAQVPPITDEKWRAFRSDMESVASKMTSLIDISFLPEADVLNVLMQIYFEKAHPEFPILHKATFDSSNVSNVLLLAIIMTGAYHKDHNVALVLQELLREVIRVTVEFDNALVRTVEWNQALMLWQQIAISLGNKRILEICESHRSLLVVHCRRAHFLVEPYDDGSAKTMDLELSWATWREREARKRLGLAIWLADAKFATQFHCVPYMTLDDLQCSLPCDKKYWNARTAKAWQAHLYLKSQYPETPMIRDMVDCARAGNEIVVDEMSRMIILQALRMCDIDSCSLYTRRLGQPARTGVTLSRALELVKPTQDGKKDALSDTCQLLYYVHQLELTAPVMFLHAMAGRQLPHGLRTDIDLVLREWASSRDARRSVLYAAFVFYHLSNFPTHSADEPVAAFNCALTLWAYACYTPTTSPTTAQSTHIIISTHSCPQQSLFEEETQLTYVVLEGVGPLDMRNSARALSMGVDLLDKMFVCTISKTYSQILQHLINLYDTTS